MSTAVTLDVVHLPRMRRLADDHPAAAVRRLLHPSERTDRPTPRDLAASLAAKEAWVKARGSRPPGWAVEHSALAPADADLPAAVAALAAVLAADLRLDRTDVGRVRWLGDGTAGCGTPVDDTARWTATGVRGDWLVAAVLG